MILKEEFIKKNTELTRKVIEEIANVQKGLSKKNILQLNSILHELNLMVKQKNLNIYYPRIIVDSWDHSDQLGFELLELSDLYKKIKS